MVPLIKLYLQMACETWSFADELFCILDCGRIYFFLVRLEQNQFNHLYESEKNESLMLTATMAGKQVLQGNILHSKKKCLSMF